MASLSTPWFRKPPNVEEYSSWIYCELVQTSVCRTDATGETNIKKQAKILAASLITTLIYMLVFITVVANSRSFSQSIFIPYAQEWQITAQSVFSCWLAIHALDEVGWIVSFVVWISPPPYIPDHQYINTFCNLSFCPVG